ncbi:transmembrane protease serine 2-like [Coregonus clupeaformis]|uniref:Peptidase S1 domain-containing protein n=1 Tax=Coregonus suidteri TaxID=861788 RepID=A0AAN8KSL8_9TELE|nr:transmembrane protease serine 2-like [Coregonus clupeaformis]
MFTQCRSGLHCSQDILDFRIWQHSFWWSCSSSLMEAEVSLIDRTICNSSSVYNRKITHDMICPRRLDGGVDSCQGDSGCLLVTEKDSVWWLVGTQAGEKAVPRGTNQVSMKYEDEN